MISSSAHITSVSIKTIQSHTTLDEYVRMIGNSETASTLITPYTSFEQRNHFHLQPHKRNAYRRALKEYNNSFCSKSVTGMMKVRSLIDLISVLLPQCDISAPHISILTLFIWISFTCLYISTRYFRNTLYIVI